MITYKNQIRIRYDEVDKMGYVYHGNYAKYYHISRTELFRKLGICDKELENHNIMLPVVCLKTKYLKPIFYDDIITIKTHLDKMPGSRMLFHHEVRNQNNELINKAESTVAFVDIDSRKPIRAPKIITSKIEKFIENKTDNEHKKFRI